MGKKSKEEAVVIDPDELEPDGDEIDYAAVEKARKKKEKKKKKKAREAAAAQAAADNDEPGRTAEDEDLDEPVSDAITEPSEPAEPDTEPDDEGDEGGEPYGDGQVTLPDWNPHDYPVVAGMEEMPDDIMIKHLLGRHADILKGQTTLKGGAPLRAYRALHMRVHNSGMITEHHVHQPPDED